jgi:hypothetical protein
MGGNDRPSADRDILRHRYIAADVDIVFNRYYSVASEYSPARRFVRMRVDGLAPVDPVIVVGDENIAAKEHVVSYHYAIGAVDSNVVRHSNVISQNQLRIVAAVAISCNRGQQYVIPADQAADRNVGCAFNREPTPGQQKATLPQAQSCQTASDGSVRKPGCLNGTFIAEKPEDGGCCSHD